MAGVFIVGMGYHHPERRVTNDDLARVMDTSDDWIREHTGIVERRYADADVDTSDLGVVATRNALDDAGWDPADLDLLICATSTPDCLIPSTASYIANKLELPSVAFDVNAACSGFVYGLGVAEGMIKTGRYERVAVCAAEKYTRVVDPADRANAVFWGDSAATVLLQAEAPALGAEVVDVVMTNRNEGADLVKIPQGGFFGMDGHAVRRIAFEGLVQSARGMLARHGLTTDDLSAFVAHQANLRMLEALGEELNVNGTRHWHNVETRGNQGAAGAATTLISGIEAHGESLRHGDPLLVTVCGSGFTGGSALLRWVDVTEAQ